MVTWAHQAPEGTEKVRALRSLRSATCSFRPRHVLSLRKAGGTPAATCPRVGCTVLLDAPPPFGGRCVRALRPNDPLVLCFPVPRGAGPSGAQPVVKCGTAVGRGGVWGAVSQHWVRWAARARRRETLGTLPAGLWSLRDHIPRPAGPGQSNRFVRGAQTAVLLVFTEEPLTVFSSSTSSPDRALTSNH